MFFCSYTKSTGHDIIGIKHFLFFFSFRLCNLPVFLQHHNHSMPNSLVLQIIWNTLCFIQINESKYFTFLSALYVWATQYHIQNATSVWSLEGAPRNSHDIRIPYINHGCQQRPHPFLSKQPIPSCFFSACRSQISWEHHLKTPAVRIFSLKRSSYTHPDSKCVQQDPGLYIHITL